MGTEIFVIVLVLVFVAWVIYEIRTRKYWARLY